MIYFFFRFWLQYSLLTYIKDEEGTICVCFTIFFVTLIDLGSQIWGAETWYYTIFNFGLNQFRYMLCTLNDKFTSKKESGLQIIWGSFFRSLKLVFTTWMETTPIQQLACSDAVASSILQQLHQHIQHQQQELQKLQQENCCNHQSQPL